mgnify:CR=1 FL=1
MIYFALLLVTPARFCLEAKQKNCRQGTRNKNRDIYVITIGRLAHNLFAESYN